jgi:hypothetical protein
MFYGPNATPWGPLGIISKLAKRHEKRVQNAGFQHFCAPQVREFGHETGHGETIFRTNSTCNKVIAADECGIRTCVEIANPHEMACDSIEAANRPYHTVGLHGT